MSNNENSAKIYTGSSGGELRISLNNTKQTINATNNRAKFYSDLAEKYKDEAKEYRDNAKYYAEQNSDVTLDYIDGIKQDLENKISLKQDADSYALKAEIPLNVSQLVNDMEFTTFDAVIPEQTGNAKKVLCTDGEKLYWETNSSYNLFDIKLCDKILTYEESKGWALQGSYVYKEAIAGSRYGYPDFYNKCLEEKATAIATEVTLGGSTITLDVATNGHQFYDIANKDVVDSFFNTMGTAWFYGIDIENERILLPRNNYFEQLTVDVLNVGQSVSAGLPNIEGTFTPYIGGESNGAGWDDNSYELSGAFYRTTISNGKTTTNTTNSWPRAGLGLDASLDNPIYGNSDTVQPNAVKKLLYICVGNTEVTNSITDIVDVTTVENDTTPLFTGMYFDFTPNNISWLKAGEQANSGGIYATCYNELVNILNGETKYGELKVIDVVNMEAGVDYSEYWKVDQYNMTFTTPTKISYLPVNADTAPVIGNGMTLGLTNGDSNYGMGNVANYALSMLVETYGTSVGTAVSDGSGANGTVGVTTDASKSGLVADLSLAKSSTALLYFKVANVVQNAEILNAGEVLEAVHNILPSNSNLIAHYAMPSNKYENLTLGASGSSYTAQADGYFCWKGRLKGTVCFFTLTNVSTSLATQAYSAYNAESGINSACFVPVKKGDIIHAEYYASTVVTTTDFKFVYAVGTESEV